ncbi:PACT-coil-coil domain-containing protein [Mycena indigotica]|uniref:PACT-coil-coil domain-containing protein n=1 Tax=Mycena indigotica TaxID=2126181 RepID=A0A8H6WB78_9AGAR|nr:PACT-coil-coil domain-containing protein [Mycena indigotica]KAF7309931.1 PACT-coil-coil domain-containing protein [Mycena indigotica]
MAGMLETPSRIWRRIESIENRDMPSLPSLPLSEEDNDEFDSHSVESHSDNAFPIHSTPAASSHHASTMRAASSTTSSASRFANSIARTSRSSNTRSSTRRSSGHNSIDSFDVSRIPSLPQIQPEYTTGHYTEDEEAEQSEESVPEVYLPPEDDDADALSLTDALELVSSPQRRDATPKKNYDYSPSPYDKFRNVALRRPPSRARTPSLSRTAPSPTSSPANSTPRSNASLAYQQQSPLSATRLPLPRSRTASPAIVISRPPDDESESEVHEISYEGSMDITDIHVSPAPLENGNTLPASEEDSREPTFSSEGGPTYQADQTISRRLSPSKSPAALSSPATSIAATPTPAAPRPRARFNLPHNDPTPSNHNEDETDEAEPTNDQVLTPHTRRRSFLLSVINSTARPRLKFPTPHPRYNFEMEDATPGPKIAGLQTTLAGATPRLPRRGSHPLANTHLAQSPATPEAEGGGRISPSGWATPGPGHDGASVISTASSHDLTTHHYRANTSFDPAMGFNGAQALHGVGRFNAGKLNTYLHGLNRRLQEENETLAERIRELEGSQSDGGSRRSSLGGASRRTSLATMPLGNVAEDVAGEGWLEEKAEMEELIQVLKEEVEQHATRLSEAQASLEEEKAGRSEDKESWKHKMREVERGVNEHVGILEQRATSAEKRAESAEKTSRQAVMGIQAELEQIQSERDAAVERAAKAEHALEGDRELGGELREAHDRLEKALAELRNANSQIKALEDEVIQADARLDDLEKELKSERAMTRELDDELNVKTEEMDALSHEHSKMQQDLTATKAFVEELEQAVKEAVEQTESLQDQLAAAHEEIDQLQAADDEATEHVDLANSARERADELARQLEDALEAAEKTMHHNDEEIAQLRTKITSLERECERLRERSISSHNILAPGPTEAEMNELEDELDAANREIARLTRLLEQSPARKAIETARETKIEMLEKERDELLERNKALRMTVSATTTPNKLYNLSNISPIHRHVLSMSMRAPKTPGGPLRDMSWLNATAADGSVSPLLAEIQRLQLELDRANQSIDDKLDKLEDNGLGVVGLTKRLADAKTKIAFLEDEVARLSRREDRRLKRLERARCHKCLVKLKLDNVIQDESSMDAFSATLPTEPPTPPTRTTDVLRSDLRSVNANLNNMKRQWEEEKERLLGEKAVLQDAANRLNVKVRSAEEEARQVTASKKTSDKLKAGIEGELEQARRTIAELEADLKAERSRLRASAAEQTRAQRERENVLVQLQRTETDMRDVKQQLLRLKDENRELEGELRVNDNAEQKARLLEVRVSENAELVEQLRQERAFLVSDHKELQRKLTEITEQTNRLRAEYRTSQASHNDRQHELDIQQAEINDLRQALDGQADQLQRTAVEKDRLVAEKGDVTKTIAALQAEMARVRREAEALGRDLKHLRSEKERLESKHNDENQKAERARKQSQAQLRVLTEQLEGQREKATRAKEELKNHVCVMDERQVSAIKSQHNRECKGLMVHIKYLKAQVTRETSLRNSLRYQKEYLLVLMSKFERSENTILASIAQIGFPLSNAPPPQKKQKRLKTVALTVIFLARVKRASEWWKGQRESKQAVRTALEEVRRNRAIVAS